MMTPRVMADGVPRQNSGSIDLHPFNNVTSLCSNCRFQSLSSFWRGTGSDARARTEPAFRGTGQEIETWLGVITEQLLEGRLCHWFQSGPEFWRTTARDIDFASSPDSRAPLRKNGKVF